MNGTTESQPALSAPLRRRARVIFAAILAADALVLVVLLVPWAAGLGVSGSVVGGLLVLSLILGFPTLLVGLEPFRKMELRQTVGTEPPPVGRVLLFVAGPLVPAIPLCHWVLGEPWRASIARSVAILAYFTVYIVLARVQRRGLTPYLRPAWYGFFLAGFSAALVWSVAAGAEPWEGLDGCERRITGRAVPANGHR